MDDDLLLRMSKKIAQLTKVGHQTFPDSCTHLQRLTALLPQLLQVIYHLNNKNEDCEFDMQELADQYESEIEQVLKESAAKIDAILEQLRQQEASQQQEAAVLQVCDARQLTGNKAIHRCLQALSHEFTAVHATTCCCCELAPCRH